MKILQHCLCTLLDGPLPHQLPFIIFWWRESGSGLNNSQHPYFHYQFFNVRDCIWIWMIIMQPRLFIVTCIHKQCGIHLEVDLKGSNATNLKQDKIFFPFTCLNWGLNPWPFSPQSSAVPSEPSILDFWNLTEFIIVHYPRKMSKMTKIVKAFF